MRWLISGSGRLPPFAYSTSVSWPVRLSVVSPLLARRPAFTVPSRTVRAIGAYGADEVNAVARPCADCDTAPSSRPTAHPRAGAVVIVMGTCDSHDRDPSPSDCGPCSASFRGCTPRTGEYGFLFRLRHGSEVFPLACRLGDPLRGNIRRDTRDYGIDGVDVRNPSTAASMPIPRHRRVRPRTRRTERQGNASTTMETGSSIRAAIPANSHPAGQRRWSGGLVNNKPQRVALNAGEKAWMIDALIIEPATVTPQLSLYGRMRSPRTANVPAGSRGSRCPPVTGYAAATRS